MDAPLDAVHRVLLLHLHCVTQAEGPEEQVLVLLQIRSTCYFRTTTLQRQITDHSRKVIGITAPTELEVHTAHKLISSAFLFLILLLTTPLLL